MRKTDPSTTIIIKIVIVLLVLAFLYLIKDILAMVFFALIIGATVAPGVTWLQKFRIPRPLGALLIYAVFIVGIGGLLYLVIPPLVGQMGEIFKMLPDYLKNSPLFQKGTGSLLNFFQGEETAVANFSRQFSQALGNMLSGVFKFFGGAVMVILTMVLSFFFSVQEQGIKRFLKATVPQEHQATTFKIITRAQRTFSHWVRGELILGLCVGLLVYIGLALLKVRFALLLGILAGIFELLPFIGPILSAIPGVILAFTISLPTGFIAAGIYTLVQQLENHILVPQIMKKSVGLNPIVVIIAVLIGGKLGGIAGVIISVPLLAIIAAYLKDQFGFDINIGYFSLAPGVEAKKKS